MTSPRRALYFLGGPSTTRLCLAFIGASAVFIAGDAMASGVLAENQYAKSPEGLVAMEDIRLREKRVFSVKSECEVLHNNLTQTHQRINALKEVRPGLFQNMKLQSQLKIGEEKNQALRTCQAKLKQEEKNLNAFYAKQYRVYQSAIRNLIERIEAGLNTKNKVQLGRLNQQLSIFHATRNYLEQRLERHEPIQDIQLAQFLDTDQSDRQKRSQAVMDLRDEILARIEKFEKQLNVTQKEVFLREQINNFMDEERFYGETSFIHAPARSDRATSTEEVRVDDLTLRKEDPLTASSPPNPTGEVPLGGTEFDGSGYAPETGGSGNVSVLDMPSYEATSVGTESVPSLESNMGTDLLNALPNIARETDRYPVERDAFSSGMKSVHDPALKVSESVANQVGGFSSPELRMRWLKQELSLYREKLSEIEAQITRLSESAN